MRLTMAQALLKFLSNQYIELDGVEEVFVHGVFAIFGHGNVTGLGEALEFSNEGLRCYQGHNEQGMAHAATAFAKQKNRRGIIACTSSIGPGATNMVTAAATATANRIPLLLLPGDVFASRQPDPVLQQIEQGHDYSMTVNDCLKPVSVYWDRINRPEQLMSACLNAFRVLTSPAKTGAVTLCLPQDVQAESYDYPEYFFAKRVWTLDRLQAPKRQLEKAKTCLMSAKKPLIIAGGGVHYSESCVALRDFAHRHGIPVAETQAGKSALTHEDSLNVGGIGVTGSAVANQLAHQADCILAIGTRLQDFTTASKTAFRHARLIHINVNDLDGLKMDGLWLAGDAKQNINALSDCLGDYQTAFSYQQQIHAMRMSWLDELKRVRAVEGPKGLMQTRVLARLNEFMAEKDVIISAAGSLPGCLHRLWCSKKPKDYHVEYAYSCMGYEVAAGLGVAMANPKGHAYVLVGDGSFLMMHSELVTAIQEGINMTVVLLDNGGYQCINQLQKAHGSQGFATEFNRREQGTLNGAPLNIDFMAYAKALGVWAHRAETLDELDQQLIKCRKLSGPSLIELKVVADSMSQGYDSWWRVGVAEVSNQADVIKAHRAMSQQLNNAREY